MRPLLLPLLALTACAELHERRVGVLLRSYDCRDIPADGVPIDSRYPVGAYCYDGVCTGDIGSAIGENAWTSAGCLDSRSSPNGTVRLALMPFDPDLYELNQEPFPAQDEGYPIALTCLEMDEGLRCLPWPPDFTRGGDTHLHTTMGYQGYVLVDWSDEGLLEVIHDFDPDESIEPVSAVPLVHICADGDAMVDCEACTSWTIRNDRFFPTCSYGERPDLVVHWL